MSLSYEAQHEIDRREAALERLQRIVGYAMDALYGNPVPKDAAVNYALVGRAKRVYDAWLAAEAKIDARNAQG